jgi:16S rRNA (cytosine1402-N4)-methyltransferase
MSETGHIPVLLREVLDGLAVKSGGWYVDCTVGLGGHSAAILEASAPDGQLLGLDADERSLEQARLHLKPFGDRAHLVHANFRALEQVAQQYGISRVDGIFLDLGLSSWQLADTERGFSFQTGGPADMRFDATTGASAAELVNTLSEEELASILWKFGEEPRSRRIARALIAARPIQTSNEIAAVVEGMTGRRRRIHPATRTFQALRIAANQELEGLKDVLPQAVRLLAPQSRLAVISFHSLEDRIVKEYFRQESKDCICPPKVPVCVCGHRATIRLITKRPIAPSNDEIATNPRARSAKLRIAEKL